MKKWQLPEAKKNLEKIIDQVLQGSTKQNAIHYVTI